MLRHTKSWLFSKNPRQAIIKQYDEVFVSYKNENSFNCYQANKSLKEILFKINKLMKSDSV